MINSCGSRTGAAVLRRTALLLADTSVLDKHTARYLKAEAELQLEDGMTWIKKKELQEPEAYCTTADITGSKYQMELQ